MRIKKFSEKHIKTMKELGVETIYLFGSHAKGNPGLMSDVDIGVVFSEPEKYKGKTMDAYSKIYDIFQDVLPKSYLRKRFEMRAHEYDIVFLQFAPITMQYKAARDGVILYQDSLKSTADYKEKTMLNYFDFRFVENIFNDALINGATSI